ncbi:DCL family protein [Jiella pelagia]|uniref:DCL family protein n=1 Tax=Jiella pelagia TaxID=2986949 RepID=A0ABY7BV64_9HYPH|nr:DCL family protein [Jiella pelagia]WAP67694.1 DCL family protein [Jiella pelagia]
MPAKPVNIGSIVFPKKGDATAFFQSMLYKYELGDKVSDEDANVLSALVSNHPEAAAKIGVGIASFSVRTADFGTRCFWVNRSDGSTEKFSFRACY